MTRTQTIIFSLIMIVFLMLPVAGIVALRVDTAEAQAFAAEPTGQPAEYSILTSRHMVGWTAEGNHIYKINDRRGVAIACIVRVHHYLSGHPGGVNTFYPLPLSVCFQE